MRKPRKDILQTNGFSPARYDYVRAQKYLKTRHPIALNLFLSMQVPVSTKKELILKVANDILIQEKNQFILDSKSKVERLQILSRNRHNKTLTNETT